MENIRKKVCSTCGRKRKDHPTPFGQKCTLTPLSDAEKEKVLKEVEAEETGGNGKPNNLPSNEQDIESQLEAIRLESQRVEQARKDAAEKIRLQEAALSVKNKQEELLKAQEYLASLKLGLEGDQRRIIELDASINSPLPSASVPPVSESSPAVHSSAPATVTTPVSGLPVISPVTAAPSPGVPLGQQPAVNPYTQAALNTTPTPTYTMPPTSQRDGPFVRPAPPPPLPANYLAYLDPAQQVYARASVSQYGVQPAVAQPRPPGATAARLLQDNPGLAAAAGGWPGIPADVPVPGVDSNADGKKNPGPQTHGKSVAENFIYKAAAKEKDRPTFYEFIHGALRLIKYRVKHDKESAIEHITYYERLCNLACQYRWHAVFDLHTYWSNEVEEERASWDEEIPGTDIARYCHGYAQVHAPSSVVDGESRKHRKDSVRNRNRDNIDRSDRSGSSSDSGIKDGLCRRFNKEPGGCRFGADCKFFHRCSECDARGEREVHPAIWCPYKSRDGGQSGGAGTSSGR